MTRSLAARLGLESSVYEGVFRASEHLTLKRFTILFFKNGLLAVSLTAAAALAAATTMRAVIVAQEVPVPALEGQSMPRASALAGEMGLLVRVEGRRFDPAIEKERIVAQDPPLGSTLKAERSIRVWLSLGPERLTVPAVVGDQLRSARLSLEQASLDVARVVEIDDDTKPGVVLVQRPPHGETEGASDGVALLVSRGRLRPEYVMPDLIGRAAEGLADHLETAGLRVIGVSERPYAGVLPGTVIRQQPPAGHKVNPGVAISFEVSRANP